MADPDLIARLYPVATNSFAKSTFQLNQTRFRPSRSFFDSPARSEGGGSAPGEGDRESTQAPEDVDPDDYLDCLELRFSNGPRTSRGFVFGRDEKCDIVLASQTRNASSHHFAITFEDGFEDTDKYRLVLRDLNSTFGTVVQYGGRGGESRRGFRWILSDHAGVDDSAVVVQASLLLQFRIVVHIKEISHGLVRSVDHFLRERPAESLFADLGLRILPRTEAPTGAHTPKSGPILLNMGELGRGAFGVATRWWDVSTGREFARKRPLQQLCADDRRAWREEAKLLRKLSHEHIVKIFGVVETPHPVFGNAAPDIELHLECVLGGTLDQRLPLKYVDCLDVACQGLSALAYLHGHDPPIVHRDIKPQNILVKDGPRGICIKLADFGLSREDRSLTTICGTRLYFAPEIAEEELWRMNGGISGSYSPAVDIWSLGVVILECLAGLPAFNAYTYQWCRDIIGYTMLATWQPDAHELYDFLLSRMLVLDPEARGSAQQCHDQVIFIDTGHRIRMELDGALDGQFFPGFAQLEDWQSALARISNAPRPLSGTIKAQINEHAILPTIEYDEDGPPTVVATGPSPSPSFPAPASSRILPATRRHTPRQLSAPPSVSPTASRRKTPERSSYSSSATITPKRITRSAYLTTPPGRQHPSGYSARHARRSSRSSIGPEDIPEEEEGAESGYFASNPFLDPLVVGSEIARMGRESASSAGTTQTGAGRVPQSTVRPPQQGAPRAGVDESTVVLRDDWLYKPASEN